MMANNQSKSNSIFQSSIDAALAGEGVAVIIVDRDNQSCLLQPYDLFDDPDFDSDEIFRTAITFLILWFAESGYITASDGKSRLGVIHHD